MVFTCSLRFRHADSAATVRISECQQRENIKRSYWFI